MVGMDFVRLAFVALLRGRVRGKVLAPQRFHRDGRAQTEAIVEMVTVGIVVTTAEMASGMGLTVATVLVSLAMARARAGRAGGE